MIHSEFNIDLDYEKFGIKHQGAPATITTYIKEM